MRSAETHLAPGKEKRHMGAAVAITRHTPWSEYELLAFYDGAKNEEIVTGMKGWLDTDPTRLYLSVPGGGRGVTGEGREETIVETAVREMKEELIMDEVIGESIATAVAQLHESSDIQHQQAPFLAAQARFDAGMYVLAVTSLHIPYDHLSSEVQEYINEKCGVGLARWESMRELRSYYLYTQSSERRIEDFRPHVFAIAYYWLMQQELRTDEAINYFAEKNPAAFQAALFKARQLSLPIINGAFASTGQLLPTKSFTPEDAAFLNLK